MVGVLNRVFTALIPQTYGATHQMTLAGGTKPIVTEISKIAGIWAVEAALLVGILTVLVFAFKTVKARFAEGTKAAVAGSLMASMNTASEYGFGAIIAALPGFLIIAEALKAIPNPLINEAITVTTLAGITGSATGGMSIALAAMADQFIAAANAAGIPLESCTGLPRWPAAGWTPCRTTAPSSPCWRLPASPTASPTATSSLSPASRVRRCSWSSLSII